MLMGVSHAISKDNNHTRIIVLEPSTSRVSSTGTPGTHHLEGIGVAFVLPLLNKNDYDEIGARQMARRLAREEGIFSGTSTGLNVVGVLHLARKLGPGYIVVTVAVDTGLYKEENKTSSC